MKKLITAAFALVPYLGMAQSSVTATKSVALDKWDSSYSNETYGPAIKQTKKNYSSNHFLSISRKIGDSGASAGITLGGVSSFGELTGANDPKAGTASLDHYLKLVGPSLFENESVTLTPQLRVYSAMSDNSKKAGLQAIYNARLYTSGSVGNLDLTYGLFTYYYTYKELNTGNKRFKHAHFLSGNYNIGSFSLDLFVYPTWSYAEGKNVAYNDLNFGPGVSYRFNSKVAVSAWIDTYAVNYSSEKATMAASLSVALL